MRSRRLSKGIRIAGLLLTVLSFAPALAQAPAGPPAYSIAVLQTLDKVTGRVSTLEAPIEQTVRFGTLDIMVRSCRKRPPEETPESAAFLQVVEQKPGADKSVAESLSIRRPDPNGQLPKTFTKVSDRVCQDKCQ